MKLSPLLGKGAVFVTVFIAAGCGNNAGFGGLGTNQPPLPTTGQPNPSGASPAPAASASNNAAQVSNQTARVSVDGASARLAYDGTKAGQRLIEFVFSLKNTTADAFTANKLTVSAGDEQLPDMSLSLPVLPNRTTAVTTVTSVLPRDNAKLDHFHLSFMDDKGKALAQTDIDAPHADAVFAPLDEKHPSSGASIDTAEINRLSDQDNKPRYDCSFVITNATKEKLSVSRLTVSPPKGKSASAPISLDVPPRSTTGMITVVLAYAGKTLPSGKYTIVAMGAKNDVIAKATTSLI